MVNIRLILAFTFLKDLAKCRDLVCVTKIWRLDLFLFSIQHDPTPNNMANRDNDEDRNRRKNFRIDQDAFASDDDAFVSSDDDPFVNISQNKKSGNVLVMMLRLQSTVLMLGIAKPKNLANSQAKKMAPVVTAELIVNQNPNLFWMLLLSFPPNQCFSHAWDAEDHSYDTCC